MPHELEMHVYRQHVAHLVAAGEEGRFTLVCGDQIDSTWDTHGDAYAAGVRLFGLGRFMIKEVCRDDVPPFEFAWTKNAVSHASD